MDDKVLWTLIIGYGLGLLLGIVVSRKSLAKEKIYSGMPATVLHFLACVGFGSALPLVLSGVILGLGFNAVLLALGTFAATFLILIVYAVLEMPAHEKAIANQPDRGWTAEDARTSGL